jgi:multidrug efflux system membrane fusion protein
MDIDEGPKRRRRTFLGQLIRFVFLAGVAALAIFAYSTWGGHQQAVTAQPAPQSVPVQTGVVEPRAIDIMRSGLGYVQAWQLVNITPQVGGRIAELPFHEGKVATKDAVLVRLDPRPFQAALDAAKARKAQDQANLANTQLNLSRDQTLLTKGGFATQQTVDNEKAQVQMLQAAIEGDDAAIETAQLNLEYATFKAPFTGVVSLRNIDSGNLVTPASVIGTITQIEPIAVNFTLPQSDLEDLQAAEAKGAPAVLVYNESGKTLLAKGVLEVINNQIADTSGTIKLKARFDNKDHRLWPGAFVQVKVVIRTEPQALAVATTAIEHGPNGAYVWVVSADRTARRQPVGISATEGGLTVVSSGLKAGDRIVVAGQYGVTQGARVSEASPSQVRDQS